jgi:phosphoserine aminotransferase
MDQDQISWVENYLFCFIENDFFFFEELSHRSSTFAKIIQEAERDIREIL